MVRPGASPATYEPKPQQMVALSRTKIYFAIGVPFENVWLEKIAATNPDMEVVHTDQGIQKLEMKAHHHHDEHAEEHHDEQHDDERHHEEMAKEEDHHDHQSRGMPRRHGLPRARRR